MVESNNNPIIPFFTQSPAARAIATKFVSDQNTGNVPVVDGVATPSPTVLNNVSNMTAQNIRDAENILSTQPDIEIAMSVLISAVVSPNDLREPTLTWTCDGTDLPSELVNSMLEYIRGYFEDEYRFKDMLVPLLKDCLFRKGSYPMIIIPESSVDDIINNNSGIRASTEAFKQLGVGQKGYLNQKNGIFGPNNQELETNKKEKRTPTLESILTGRMPSLYSGEINLGKIGLTDNIDVLKIPSIIDVANSAKVNMLPMRRHSMEALAQKTNTDVDRLMNNLTARRQYRGRLVQRVTPMTSASRLSIGHPLTMLLPPESIMPVHLPSDPENPLGFFVLHDPLTGHPVNQSTEKQYMNTLNFMSDSADASSKILERTSFLSNGFSTNTQQHKRTLDELIAAYSKEFEREMAERFTNGLYGHKVNFPNMDEFYRIMLARTLANQATQILYVPAELMTYFAFDYDEYGIGISMLEKMKVLASLRSVLLFSNVMGAMSNSTPRREVQITLDQEDPEPEKTVEIMMTEYAKMQSNGLPINTTNPKDIIDGIRKAATSFIVTGNSAYPEVAMGVNDVTTSRTLIDTDLMDKIDKQFFQGFSLTPELIDSTANIEFASVALNSHLLFTKRVSLIQNSLSLQMGDFVSKYTMNSGELLSGLFTAIQKYLEEKKDRVKDQPKDVAVDINQEQPTDETVPAPSETILPVEPSEKSPEIFSVAELADLVKQTAKDAGIVTDKSDIADDWMSMVQDFVDNITISLPAPDNTKLANQIDQFNQYAQALDAVLPMYISTDVLRAIGGSDVDENADAIMEIVKGYFLRDYAARNNIMPELNKLLSAGNDEDTPLDIMAEHNLHIDGIAKSIGSLISAMKARSEEGDGNDDTGTGYSEPTEDNSPEASGDLSEGELEEAPIEDIPEGLPEETPAAEETPEPEEPAEPEESDNSEEKDQEDNSPPEA